MTATLTTSMGVQVYAKNSYTQTDTPETIVAPLLLPHVGIHVGMASMSTKMMTQIQPTEMMATQIAVMAVVVFERLRKAIAV